MAINPKKILVTGAGGYIGRHVVKALIDLGHTVLASDFRFDGVDERAQRIDVPIFSGDQDIFAQVGQPDVCLHMAWRDGFAHNSDAHMADLSGHYTFLKKMMSGGLKQLAVMGTMHEVGYWEGAIQEDTPTNPSSLYGIAKDSLRRSTSLLAQQNDVILQWLRCYYIIGDDLHNNSIFSKLVQSEQEGKELFPFTTGKNKYDFISVFELAEQIALTVSQDEVRGVINCCKGTPVSLAEQVETFISEHHFKIRLNYGVYPERPYDSPAVWGDPDKINQILKNSKN